MTIPMRIAGIGLGIGVGIVLIDPLGVVVGGPVGEQLTFSRSTSTRNRRALAVIIDTGPEDGVVVDDDGYLVVSTLTFEAAIPSDPKDKRKGLADCGVRNLCEGELPEFRSMPVAASCGAVALGPWFIATTSHCHSDRIEGASAFFVLGYDAASVPPPTEDQVTLRIPPERWVRATYKVSGGSQGGDWALFRSKRRLDVPPVELVTEAQTVEAGDAVLLAFASRLPLTQNANSTKLIPKKKGQIYEGFFSRFETSSGGPVFVGDSLLGLLEGGASIEKHWEIDGDCCRPTRCSKATAASFLGLTQECAGAHVVSAGAFAAALEEQRAIMDTRLTSSEMLPTNEG